MNHSPFRMRLFCVLTGLLLTALLPACARGPLAAVDPANETAPTSEVAPTNGALPTAVPTSVATASNTTYNGFTYQIDSAVASRDTFEVVPAVAGTAEDPYWMAAPEFRQVTLNDYPVVEHAFKPQINIYPVEGFKAANPEAAKVIDALQSLLQSPQDVAELPFLPLINARQVLHSHLQTLDFQNGRGIAYLTEYDSGMTPINNHELIYTFQGLTNDGKYYVVAVLPVTHASLPADGTVTGEPVEPSAFPQYLAGVAAALDAQPAGSFSPDLGLLDEMIRTFEVQ